MSAYDRTRDYLVDVELENAELRSKVDESTAALLAEQRRRVDAEVQLRFMADKLREREAVCEPVQVGEGEVECSDCWADLAEDYTFCPSCGHWIDWNMLAPMQPDEGMAYDEWRDGQMELAMAAGGAR